MITRFLTFAPGPLPPWWNRLLNQKNSIHPPINRVDDLLAACWAYRRLRSSMLEWLSWLITALATWREIKYYSAITCINLLWFLNSQNNHHQRKNMNSINVNIQSFFIYFLFFLHFFWLTYHHLFFSINWVFFQIIFMDPLMMSKQWELFLNIFNYLEGLLYSSLLIGSEHFFQFF